MTPHQKAVELIERMMFHTTEEAKKCALIHCEEVLSLLRTIKGMGKIHKISFYKKVLTELESM